MCKLNAMIVTTSRADYGLLYPLIEKMIADKYFNLDIVVTGTHLSATHGNTIERIIEDGVKISEEVHMIGEGDKEVDICNNIALGLKLFSDVFLKYSPDMIIVLGDRYELWSICIAAVIHKIPVVHLYGGEATFGVIDDCVRHSVTKMASIHFASIEEYAKRIVQMGESPENVYIVGALGIDNIKRIQLMSCNELSEFTGIDFTKHIAIMTYHPVTLDDYGLSSNQAMQVLEALKGTELETLITMPNADMGGYRIFEVIEKYVSLYPDKFKLVKNLGQKAYLSVMQYARLMVGNSSSGILESASFRLPVVNIGDRQAGRFKPKNIINCSCTKEQILNAINRAMSEEFKREIAGLKNPYGDGNSANRIINILKSIDFSNKSKLIKKGFFDLSSPELKEICLRRFIK